MKFELFIGRIGLSVIMRRREIEQLNFLYRGIDETLLSDFNACWLRGVFTESDGYLHKSQRINIYDYIYIRILYGKLMRMGFLIGSKLI